MRKKVKTKIRHRHHSVRKYILLPSCYLVLNVIEEVATYKADLIPDERMRILAIMALLAMGISFLAYVLVPLADRMLKRLYHTSKNIAGWIGEVAFLGVILVSLYYVFFSLYIYGPESLLPLILRN